MTKTKVAPFYLGHGVYTRWTKTIQQDPKSNNLSLNLAIYVALHSGDCCLGLVLCTPSGARQK